MTGSSRRARWAIGVGMVAAALALPWGGLQPLAWSQEDGPPVTDPAGQQADPEAPAEDGDGTGGAESAGVDGQQDDVQVVEIDTAGLRFTPREIQVEVGKPVRFVITAREVPHAFSIPELEFEKVLFPGSEESFELTFEEEGSLPFRCRFHGNQGMEGTLWVNPPAEEEPADGEPADRGSAPDGAPDGASDGAPDGASDGASNVLRYRCSPFQPCDPFRFFDEQKTFHAGSTYTR